MHDVAQRNAGPEPTREQQERARRRRRLGTAIVWLGPFVLVVPFALSQFWAGTGIADVLAHQGLEGEDARRETQTGWFAFWYLSLPGFFGLAVALAGSIVTSAVTRVSAWRTAVPGAIWAVAVFAFPVLIGSLMPAD